MADDKPIETWTDLTRFLDEEFAVILEKVPSSGNNAEKLGALEQLRGGLMDARHRLNDEQFKMYTDGIQAPDYLTSQTQDEDLYINRLAPALRKLYEKGAGPDDLVGAGVPADSLVYHYLSNLDRAVGKVVELKGMPAPETAKTVQEVNAHRLGELLYQLHLAESRLTPNGFKNFVRELGLSEDVVLAYRQGRANLIGVRMLDLYERGESVEFALARLQAEQNDREFLAYPGKMSREERRRLLPRSLSQYEVQVMLELEQLLRRNPRRPRLTDFAMLPPDRWKDSPDPTLLDLGVSTAVGAASAPAGVAVSLGQGMLRESEAREREQAEQGSYRGIPVPDAQRYRSQAEILRRKFDRDPWKKPVTPELKPLVPRASSSALPSSKIDPVSVNIGLNEGFEADAALGASMPHNVVIVQSGPAGDSSRAVAEQVPVAASPSQTGQIDLEGLVASMQTGMRYCG